MFVVKTLTFERILDPILKSALKPDFGLLRPQLGGGGSRKSPSTGKLWLLAQGNSHRGHIKRLQSGKKLNFVDAKNFRLQMIKLCHPRYLEASLGSKEHIFEKFHFFIHFCAFLRPKRPASKNPKKS